MIYVNVVYEIRSVGTVLVQAESEEQAAELVENPQFLEQLRDETDSGSTRVISTYRTANLAHEVPLIRAT